jgi:uncharacterized protein YcbK (DUF882 family)
MSGTTDEAGHRQPLLKRLKYALAAATLMGALVCSPFVSGTGDAIAAGETRTLHLYAINTKERLSVTYKVNGRYVPSAMAKINHLLRDWRRNKSTRMDPKTIDLMWELHADLGSKQPIHIICGYRSAGTNAFLKRIGRGVARKSQHIKGKAIDLYFPDVSTERIRNSALVRMVGGVGYYRRGGGPKGFVHIDSGNVRHWPRLAPSKLARIFKDYRSTVGRRISRDDQVMIASADAEKMKAMAAGADGEVDIDEDIAETATPATAKTAPAAPLPKPVIVASKAPDVPLPRQKPIEIFFAAAANMKVLPAAAPPETKNFAKRAKPAADALGSVEADDTILAQSEPELVVNSDGKGGFDEPVETRRAPAKKPAAKTVYASTGESDLNWWPSSLAGDGETSELPSGLFPSAHAAEPPAVEAVSGDKGDMLEVNREAKGDALLELPRRRAKVGQLIGD